MDSPIPTIFVSSPLDDQLIEATTTTTFTSNEDVYRPTLLSPPPTGLSRSSYSSPRLSPLRPVESITSAKGLEPEKFEALLKSSRSRDSIGAGRKSCDLRKEVALKAHNNKQVQRRALFLSKIQAPPSPTATTLPKTPPDSPSVFHFSLPSPGLESPLALFDSISNDDPSRPEPWIEQVDFRLLAGMRSKHPSHVVTAPARPPSLAEITARLGQSPTYRSREQQPPAGKRLPAFLRSERPASTIPFPESVPVVDRGPQPTRSALLSGVGRLQLPVQSPSPKPARAAPSPVRMVSLAETREAPLAGFDCRARKSQHMLSAIRRRTTPSPPTSAAIHDDEERKGRRMSAPAELPRSARSGFEHPVLSMPGGF